jgi:hypothetical protein
VVLFSLECSRGVSGEAWKPGEGGEAWESSVIRLAGADSWGWGDIGQASLSVAGGRGRRGRDCVAEGCGVLFDTAN